MHGAGGWRVAVGYAAALLALCAAPRPALSQSAPPAAPGAAGAGSPSDAPRAEQQRALYREGVEAATAGRWADARDRFRQVLAIRSSPKVLFSLAQAEEQLGQVASAQADYGRALEGAKAAGEAEVVSAAEQAIAAITPRVPHVRVVVTGASAPGAATAASATLDGQPVAVGAPVAVDPGSHRLVVSAPGMREAATSVAIGERGQLDVPVRLEAAEAAGGAPAQSAPAPAAPAPVQGAVAAPPAGPETAPSAGGSAVPWPAIGLVVAGAGVVGLGIGTAFGLEAKSKNDQSNSSGCNGANCTASAAAVRRDAISAGNASTVAFVVGGVLAAGGVVLWLVAPSAAGEGGVGVTPVAMGEGGGMLVSARWR